MCIMCVRKKVRGKELACWLIKGMEIINKYLRHNLKTRKSYITSYNKISYLEAQTWSLLQIHFFTVSLLIYK